MKVNVKLDGGLMPTKAHWTDAGFDLYTPIPVNVWAGNSVVVDTGVHMIIPEGYCGLLVSKSGLLTNYGITTTGLVDAGYTGTIKVKILNQGHTSYFFDAGDKISQIIILPVPDVELVKVDELPETERGSNGFGSSGR